MAETEQWFILHARSRNIARIIGYPAGLFLLALGGLAVAFGAGDLVGWGIFIAVCAPLILLWTWSMDRRRRVEVTEQKLTVVNTFSRYVVVWRELSDIELEKVENQGGGTAFHRLAFVTPTKRMVADVPAGSRREMMKARDHILQARDQSLPNEPQSHVGIAVNGAAAVADRLRLFCRSIHGLRKVLASRALFSR